MRMMGHHRCVKILSLACEFSPRAQLQMAKRLSTRSTLSALKHHQLPVPQTHLFHPTQYLVCFLKVCMVKRTFSRDVMAAILVIQNNQTAATFVYRETYAV